jgi:hypothetical protein
MLSSIEEAINRGEPIRLYRSEFAASPAEHMLTADDRDAMIELLRYHQVTHAVVPLGSNRETRSFYRYDKNKTELAILVEDERRCDCQQPNARSAHSETVIGQVITVRPYGLNEYMKDMGCPQIERPSGGETSLDRLKSGSSYSEQAA